MRSYTERYVGLSVAVEVNPIGNRGRQSRSVTRVAVLSYSFVVCPLVFGIYRSPSMKVRAHLLALVAGLLLLAGGSNANALGLFNRASMGGCGGCAVEPSCGCEASCGVAVQACCDSAPVCCSPCAKRCRPGLLARLKSKLSCCRPSCCDPCGCKPSCGCDAGCAAAAAPSCGCEPSCGCDAGCAAAAAPTCGCEPSCGVEAAPSCGCEPSCGCAVECCPKKCRPRLLDRIRSLRCKSRCCVPACVTTCCEPTCGC